MDALDLSRNIEDTWRSYMMQSIASGIPPSGVKEINVFVNVNGEFKKVNGAYTHKDYGIILDF